MKTADFLKYKSGAFYLSLGLLSLFSTCVNMGILFIVNLAVSRNYDSLFGPYNGLAFLGLITVSFFSSVYLQTRMAELTNEIIFDVEISIIQKIRHASWKSFAELGREKIYTILGDAEVLGRLPETLIIFVNTSITIICSLVYLFWLFPSGGLIISIFVISLSLVFIKRNKVITRDLNILRDFQEKYYAFLKELMDGFKQFKISTKRSEIIFNKHILNNRTASKEMRYDNSRVNILHQLSGIFSWYLLLGFIVFLLPKLIGLPVNLVATFTTTILFMMGSVSGLINIIPFYAKVKISFTRINEVDLLLTHEINIALAQGGAFSTFQSIGFKDITYSYSVDRSVANPFFIEVGDLQIGNNEIIYLTGSNGSGKTTFINMLTGLTRPDSGDLYINEQKQSWEQFRAFSNNMAVVYTDQYLFKGNYDEHDFTDKNRSLNALVDLVNAKGIFKINPSSLEIDTGLSKGQQKRISLLLALMENKPILILDEWAAEQDSLNRRNFYRDWLPKIKQMGKTIILISHDDECFEYADRIIRFDAGKIVNDELLNGFTVADFNR